MKNVVILLTLLLSFPILTKAQQKINVADFKAYQGKTITLCDVVSSFKIISDTLTLVNMGGNYPNQKFRIAIKGNKVVLDWVNLKGKQLCVTGVTLVDKEGPQIIAFEPKQITVIK